MNIVLLFSQAQEIEDTIGHVTILVNNAGVVCGQKITEADPNEIQQVMETNLVAHHWVRIQTWGSDDVDVNSSNIRCGIFLVLCGRTNKITDMRVRE